MLRFEKKCCTILKISVGDRQYSILEFGRTKILSWSLPQVWLEKISPTGDLLKKS